MSGSAAYGVACAFSQEVRCQRCDIHYVDDGVCVSIYPFVGLTGCFVEVHRQRGDVHDIDDAVLVVVAAVAIAPGESVGAVAVVDELEVLHAVGFAGGGSGDELPLFSLEHGRLARADRRESCRPGVSEGFAQRLLELRKEDIVHACGSFQGIKLRERLIEGNLAGLIVPLDRDCSLNSDGQARAGG